MFPVKPGFVKRVSFATKLYPHSRSVIGLDLKKLKTTDKFDGEIFCAGRSRNKDLLTFFGLISSSDCQAAFIQLPNFRRSFRKLTALVENELEKIGANEVLLPTLVPQKLWHQSGRLKRQQNALDNVFKLSDGDSALILAPTFEESITRMVARADNINPSDLPLIFYQTSPKFRLEPNPRFGLLRTNEFFMNDTYSFDASYAEAIQTYELISQTYSKIFAKLGLECIKIESVTGDIGGDFSHEYQLPVSSGEDTILKCNTCHQAYNYELYSEKKQNQGTKVVDSCLKCGGGELTSIQALELGHTFLLSDIYSKPLGGKFKTHDGNSAFFQMGCYGLGLTRIIGAGLDFFSLIPSSESNVKFLQMRWPNYIEPYLLAIVAPAKRSKQYLNGSSAFIEKLVDRIIDSTHNVDILVEDRDKEGIAKRIIGLQALGIPNIVTVGQRFLQDQPELELLKLDTKKEHYEQFWFSEDQIFDYIKELDEESICV